MTAVLFDPTNKINQEAKRPAQTVELSDNQRVGFGQHAERLAKSVAFDSAATNSLSTKISSHPAASSVSR